MMYKMYIILCKLRTYKLIQMVSLNYTLSDLPAIAQTVLSKSSHNVMLFYGAMGSGKTTLIKEIASQLGVDGLTSSPTFSLVNEYLSNNGELLYHFDFYRINSEEEAYDIGVEEYLYGTARCLIEWPEKVENLLPLESTVIRISINPDNSRRIEIK